MAGSMKTLAALADDDDLLLVSSLAESKSTGFKTKLDFESLTDDQCRVMFRFEKRDINVLQNYLGIPQKIICSNRTTATGIEALCVLLRRFAYPNRLDDLSPLFGRSMIELSYISNEVLNHIYNEYGYLLSDLNQPWLSPDKLQTFSNAIRFQDAPLHNCWGFIDGTIRPICRPIRSQKVVFSGHKRFHGLKFQSISTPSGMIANLYGPIEGRRHDAAMLRMSNILDDMGDYMVSPDGTTFCVYGDQAYPLSEFIISPFRGAALSAEELLFNNQMSAVRTSVEWTFGKIISIFAFLDYKKNHKLYLQPVGKYYKVGALLSNCHTCLYGSETGAYFGVDPPSLDEYLQV